MFQKGTLLLIAGILLASCAPNLAFDNQPGTQGYKMIAVAELQGLMEEEDFTFINVHIPLEGNIPGTDAEIPFDDIENYQHLLPADKDAKIVLYCRSGSMGDTASQTLLELGYTDVANLAGGYNTWVAAGLPFEED